MMKLQLDLKLLQDEALEPQQFVWLYLQFHNQIKESWLISPITDDDLDYLEHNDFIKITDLKDDDNNTKVYLRQSTFALFEEPDTEKKFEELWCSYPMKVPDGKGGYRALRAKTLDSKDAEVCRNKYLKIIRNKPGLHEVIMKSLDKQLSEERGSLQYMNNLETWINKRVYEKFIDLNQIDDEDFAGYGGDI